MSSDGDLQEQGSISEDTNENTQSDGYIGDDVSGFLRLNEDAKILDQKKQKLADDWYKKQCPFKPNILQRENNFQRSQNVYNSLYDNAKHRQDRQMKRAEQVRHQQYVELTFKPHINNPTKKRSTAEVTDRLYSQAQRKADEKFQKSLDVRNIDEECSFQPFINPESNRFVKNTVSVTERLAPTNEEIKSRIHQLERTKETLSSDGCTFAPKINSKSRNIGNITSGHNEDTFKRLYDEHREKIKKREELKRNYENELESQMVMILPTKTIKTKPDKQVFDRLYQQSKRDNNKIYSNIKSNDFKPKLINKKGKGYGIDTLYQRGVDSIRDRNKPERNKGSHSDGEQ